MDTWLIDTALFKSLAPGGPKGATLRSWIETHEDPLFLSAAFLVELKAVIDKIRGRETKRAEALQAWFDELVTTFSDKSIRSTSTSQFGRAASCPIARRASPAIASTTWFSLRRRKSMATAS